MEIKPGKYLTRDKRQAVVLEVFEGRAFGRHTILKNTWVGGSWYFNGTSWISDKELELDIIAPWEEPKPRLRVWRCINKLSFNHGYIKIFEEGEMNNSDWQPVPELDALFEKGKE